jgi:hypothetical protein
MWRSIPQYTMINDELWHAPWLLGYMSKDFAPTSMPSRPTNSTMSARI